MNTRATKRREDFRAQVAQQVAEIDLRQLARDLCDKGFRDAYLDESLAWTIRVQVRLIREDRGWTQEELAEKSGLSYATINRIENLQAPVSLQIGTLLKLAEAFDCALIIRFEAWSTYLAWLAEVKATAGALLLPKPFAETVTELERWAQGPSAGSGEPTATP